MDPLAASIVERCTAPAFKNLGALTRSVQGLGKRTIVRSRHRRGPTVFPYLCKVAAMHYYIAPGEVFPIDMAANEKRTPFFQREPKVILTRAMPNDRFCAGYAEDRMAFGREFFIITSRSLHVDAMFLLGLLGSRLYPFLYLNQFSINYAGEQKKVKLRELRKLPVPIDRPVERGLIIGLVMRILNARSRRPDVDTTTLEDQIDQLVYRMFGITTTEAQQIQNGPAQQRKLFEELRLAPPETENRPISGDQVQEGVQE